MHHFCDIDFCGVCSLIYCMEEQGYLRRVWLFLTFMCIMSLTGCYKPYSSCEELTILDPSYCNIVKLKYINNTKPKLYPNSRNLNPQRPSAEHFKLKFLTRRACDLSTRVWLFYNGEGTYSHLGHTQNASMMWLLPCNNKNNLEINPLHNQPRRHHASSFEKNVISKWQK